jgi:hypothetical protein
MIRDQAGRQRERPKQIFKRIFKQILGKGARMRIGTGRLLPASFLFGLLIAVGAAPAHACQGPETIFSDDFDDDAGGWALSSAVKIGGGDFAFDLAPDGMEANLNISHTVHGNVDICAAAVWPKDDSGILGAGVLFWGLDAKNYFQFGILNSGKYWIARKRQGEWEVIVQNVSSEAIKTEPGATNTLRVDASGDTAVFYVNGTKLRELRGQEPKSGWRFGLSADNFDKQSGAALSFASVKITN